MSMGLEREFEVILNSTHDAMIAVDSSGRITVFNAAAERLTGLTASRVLGRLAREVIPNTRLHIVLASGQAELNQIQDLGERKIITNRVPVRGENGAVTGAVAVFRDVSEVKDLAEEITNLRQMRSMLEAILNSTQDAISVVDENGLGLYINPAYTRLTGFTEEDILGKPATIDIAEGESMHLQVLRTRQPVHGARMKVGPQRKDVIVHVAPILVDGQLRGSVGVIHDVSEIRRLTEELDQARQRLRRLEARYTFADIVGKSSEMVVALEQAKRVAETPATVLLRGESGTGKEVFAHAIHNASIRRSKPFVRVNCATISGSLLESELFGYVEGAFTGAKKGGHRGLIEEAGGGTLFLDEIGEMDVPLQAKLLRVLQEKEIIPVGGAKPITVDVRVIAATNMDLEKAVREGRFREDVYYRLNVVPIVIPPLRKRVEDIPPLVRFMLKKYNQEYGRDVEGISPEALELLTAYSWPGNVRELENVIGRAMIDMHYGERVVRVEHLPSPIRDPIREVAPPDLEYSEGNGAGRAGNAPGADKTGETPPSSEGGARPLRAALMEAEKKAILAALQHARGNRTLAAKELGIAVRSLYYKLEKYALL
ncbi:MAG: sigma-54-dependent Fis family transcriptional regulator [Firmicutes bacterium]|nr:sigma-54-dependent Fis family transcriptional regulator [Bacillota bacterium]